MFVRALIALVDTILPRKERTVRLDKIELARVPLSPASHELLGVRITTLMDYREQAARDLIQSLKYDGAGKAARLLSEIVADYLTEEIASHKQFSRKKVLIAPVPLHTSRKRERGFNQIEMVLKYLPHDLLSHMIVNPLERTRATKPQTKLVRSARLSNVAGAFALREGVEVTNVHIYLIDDVTTTGATLANAATPLRRAGATVSLIALARA